MLGRAFDVFLRANFESKGGLGIYLTPAPVKQAMLALAFHDIMEETPELLSARERRARPPSASATRPAAATASSPWRWATCGARWRTDWPGDRAGRRGEEKLFAEMCEHSFVGADSSPQMVMLARVNMALLGAPKARIFYTQNSLISDQLKPGSFDLICTNPPFGTPKFNKGQEKARKALRGGHGEDPRRRSAATSRARRARRRLQLFADGDRPGDGRLAEQQGRVEG